MYANKYSMCSVRSDLRNNAPTVLGNMKALVREAEVKCDKIVLSCGLPRGDRRDLDLETSLLNVLIRHAFFPNKKITIVENAGFSYRGQVISSLYRPNDLVHLSREGSIKLEKNLCEGIKSCINSLER